jgi:hypothetical protein
VETRAWPPPAAGRGEREARDLAPAIAAEVSDEELQQARQRAQQYRQGPL